MRDGLRLAASRGVTYGARQGRLARRPAVLQRLDDEGALDAARVAVDPARVRSRARAARPPLAARRPDGCALGYLKAFMDGTLGSQTALHARRLGRRITSARGARGDRSGVGARRRACPSPCTRSATARTATRSTRSRRRSDEWRPLGLRHAHRARAMPRAGGSAALRAARRRGVGAVLARAVRPRRSPSASGPDKRRPRVRVPLALGVAAPSSRTARTRRSRSSIRSRASARACCGRSTSGRRGTPSRR